ncbi:MAG: hypothetical protein M5R42_03160 [Rhodocyclaceae bacterium]|nr:hypothetical protein [Rhodocyclaceae bacterium]
MIDETSQHHLQPFLGLVEVLLQRALPVNDFLQPLPDVVEAAQIQRLTEEIQYHADLTLHPFVVLHQFADVLDHELEQLLQRRLQFGLVLGDEVQSVAELFELPGEWGKGRCVAGAPHACRQRRGFFQPGPACR